MKRFLCPFLLLTLAAASAARAAETQTQYLSGKGKDDPVKWDFMCSAGQNSNKWSTISVPSNWELQGFGTYTYGRDTNRNGWPKVTGHYKRTFTVPADWADLKTSIVFEGSMTDTQVTVNGQSAGPIHQGGYYRFKYDISKLLKFGQENTIEVTVDDESANASVNNAERRGDYWNYGGIFRPVYLEAVPQQHIERLTIDAKADGTLNADVFLDGFPVPQNRPWFVQAQLLDNDGKPIGDPFPAPSTFDDTNKARLSTKIISPRLWTAETPNLYQLEVRVGVGGTAVHTIRQKFGFRTVEVRAGEGVFVNGSRIMFKGTDRHSFWPDSGRCLSEQISHDDVALIKEMNMNAVRMSHYPPDQHFLDACDEMGVYILDELAGWHQAYDTPTGVRLVQEMVTRDVNHPSIVFWDNGNEGGWNNALDTEFAKWDPQTRHVLHPQQTIRGIDNSHYPQYNAVVTKCNGNLPFFPTEMLHGLYDGGAGAGLEDYWNVMVKSKVSAGGFIWAFLDEDVVRTDEGGKLDSKGNQAPDGIVGPYREKEGSFYTIKQLWSPIVITRPAQGGDTFSLENRYSFTNAKDCTYTYEWRLFKNPQEPGAGYVVTLKGDAAVEGSIPPGTFGKLQLQMQDMGKTPPHDALALTAKDPSGHEIWTWVWNDNSSNRYQALVTGGNSGKTSLAAETAEDLTATVGDLSLGFSKKSGELDAVSRAGKSFSLVNGPRLVTGTGTLTSITQKADGNDLLITAAYSGDMNAINYRIHPNGWLTIDYAYTLTGAHDFFGVGFDYPDADIKSMRYLGNGPATVYQNRLAGGTLDVWDKTKNNTMVGDPDKLAPGQHFDYPIFKGYYAGVRWLQLQTTQGPITALLNQDDLFVQVLSPDVPPAGQIGQSGVTFPKAGLSFLHAIPAIGSKFVKANTTGPQGQQAVAKGAYKGSISLYFGELPQ